MHNNTRNEKTKNLLSMIINEDATFTIPFKSLGSVRLFMFLKEIYFPHQGCTFIWSKTQ